MAKRTLKLSKPTAITPSNNIRAAWAASTLEAFKLVTHAPALTSNQELLSDLLADFMHLDFKNQGKLNFVAALLRAYDNFNHEFKEEEGDPRG